MPPKPRNPHLQRAGQPVAPPRPQNMRMRTKARAPSPKGTTRSRGR